MVIFIGVITSVGVASFFIPTLFAIVPVYETEQCGAYFTGDSSFKLFTLDRDSIVFNLNVYSYLILNWLELMAIVQICFVIRAVKDELSITMEILWIAGFWIICSFVYFFCFNLPLFFDN